MKNLAKYNEHNFSYNAMVEALSKICKKYLKVSKQVDLNLSSLGGLQLPKLKKIESINDSAPQISIPKINLPNLKKIE